jgi:hypothetical protein
VNRVVKALLAHPHLVDEAITSGNAGFDFLLHRLGDELLTEPEWTTLTQEPWAGPPLRSGYLPAITATEWDQALTAAEPDDSVDAGWRTVMLPNSSGDSGLTAPQDASDEPSIALFSGPPENPQAVAYLPIAGTYVNLANGAHCQPPSRGKCGPGTCGGCRSRKVWDPATGSGITCRCPDQ